MCDQSKLNIRSHPVKEIQGLLIGRFYFLFLFSPLCFFAAPNRQQLTYVWYHTRCLLSLPNSTEWYWFLVYIDEREMSPEA
jgi:hypothetical protein